MTQAQIRHELVEFIPERLEEGVLYISHRYGTAAHKCCCGCGEEVITPLNPTDWSVQISDGMVNLVPSIGNWSFTCRSHYWIWRSKVIWAAPMSEQQIERGRAMNRAHKEWYFEEVNRNKAESSSPPKLDESVPSETSDWLSRAWRAVKRWLNP